VASDSEIRIDLPLGSYVPEFKFDNSSHPTALPPGGLRGHPYSVSLAIFAVAILTVVGLSLLGWRVRSSKKTALEQFWWPLTSSLGVPMIVVNTGVAVILPRGKDFTSAEIRQLPNKTLTVGDFVAIFAITSELQRLGRACELRPVPQLSLEEMQSHPVIAIGVFNNPWTLQLNRDVRFEFQQHSTLQTDEFLIVDKQRPERQWKIVIADSMDQWKPDIDYAIITRLIDPTTHQVFMSAGGITLFGTQAAGEFLATASYWEKVAAEAPPDWSRKNLQIVLKVRVVNDTAKPPEVVATHFW
jgi:hypothetical protein